MTEMAIAIMGVAGRMGRELVRAGQKGPGGVVGCGGELVVAMLPALVVDLDQVGERPADVDADNPHRKPARSSRSSQE